MPLDVLICSLIEQGRIRARINFLYLIGLSNLASSMHDRALHIDTKLHANMVNLFVHNGNIDPLNRDTRDPRQDLESNQRDFMYSQLICQKLVS